MFKKKSRNIKNKSSKIVGQNKAKLKSGFDFGLSLKLSSHQKKLFLFLVKFFGIFAISNILLGLVNLFAFTSLLANVCGNFLGLGVSGSTVFVGVSQFVITNSCTGLVSASILGSIIFSLKKPKFEIKLVLFLWGSIALLLFNIPRLLLVLFAAKSGFDAELVHEFTWFLMSAIVLALWFFGTKRITNISEFRELL